MMTHQQQAVSDSAEWDSDLVAITKCGARILITGGEMNLYSVNTVTSTLTAYLTPTQA